MDPFRGSYENIFDPIHIILMIKTPPTIDIEKYTHMCDYDDKHVWLV